jgi:hypothetical protein
MTNQDKSALEKALNSYFNALNESNVKNAVGSYTTDGVSLRVHQSARTLS